MPEKKKKVLFLEDDAEQVYFYRFFFERENWDFIWAADIKDALKALSEKKPDLVLVDLILNNEHGLDFLKRVKAGNEKPESRILVLTNFWNSKTEKECREAGAEDYLIKAGHSPREIVKLAGELIR